MNNYEETPEVVTDHSTDEDKRLINVLKQDAQGRTQAELSVRRETIASWIRNNFRTSREYHKADSIMEALYKAGYEIVERSDKPPAQPRGEEIPVGVAFYGKDERCIAAGIIWPDGKVFVRKVQNGVAFGFMNNYSTVEVAIKELRADHYLRSL